uniref:Reverse transcriptase n=1 Tax=Cannabis sativa TaxID=3483 RepID=A0A803QIN2_CANSA
MVLILGFFILRKLVSLLLILGDLFHCDGCDPEAVNHILDCLGPPLEDSEIDLLLQPFTFDEVQNAVFQLSGDKAPGLDGLNAYFYQRNWTLLALILFMQS